MHFGQRNSVNMSMVVKIVEATERRGESFNFKLTVTLYNVNIGGLDYLLYNISYAFYARF